ncbi:MAG: T9SS type A sorting domain-containing protein [Crocinitomicaceae bacterium]|nr:T9SS type A sorting domain-containing protein [Crocinitomicaceae bacterium]
MKKLLLSVAAIAFSCFTFGQQVLFQDDFENGGANWTFTGSGTNTWIINNSYTGLFPLIANTPNQPSGISGSPNSNYMHIHNVMMEIANISNANYQTGDYSNQDATMVNSVSTVGKTNVTFSYWYLAVGAAGDSEGKVYYSIDNGATWVLLATYSGVSTWTQATHTLAAFDNQATLKFKFNWTDGDAGNDPAFSVDDVKLTAGQADGISNLVISNSDAWCQGTTKNVTVSFNAAGTFGAGNVFTAEISDASGSFANPTSIGTLTSSSTGALSIAATVPSSMNAGNGYRIRVVSSNPSTISDSDNGVNLVINPQPNVVLANFDELCVYHNPVTLNQGSPVGGIYSGPSVIGGQFNPTTAGVGSWAITYSYTDGNGCGGQATKNIMVSSCAGIEEITNTTVAVYPNPASDKFYVSGNDIKKVVVIDLLGNEVVSYNKQLASYDIQRLNSGAYFVKVTTENGTKTFKIQVK